MTNGLDPVEEGVRNFNHPVPDVELIANERASICKGCPFRVIEPIDFLRVKDSRIESISEMMCDECGCTLPYKTRQSKTVCHKWLR